MLAMIRDYLSCVSINDAVNDRLSGNREVHNYFRAEYKQNPSAAYEYWQSTGKFNFKW